MRRVKLGKTFEKLSICIGVLSRGCSCMWWIALLVIVPAFLWWLRHILTPCEYVYNLAQFDARFPQPDGERAHPRSRGKLPPVFLNGWHLIAWVSECPAGSVKKIRLHSRDLVLFASQDGTFGLLDAYCPHLGADMSVEGQVVRVCDVVVRKFQLIVSP
jgi:hypothetical protein